MIIYRILSRQVLKNVSKYNYLAQRKHQSPLNINWFINQLNLTRIQWSKLKAGNSTISIDTYHHAIGLLKQMHYQLEHSYNMPISLDALQKSKQSSYHAQSNVIILHGNSKKMGNNSNKLKQYHIDVHNPKFKSTITKIKQQKHNTHRFNVYLGNKYAFSVGINLIAKYFLHPGMILSHKQVHNIKITDSIDYAFNKVVNYTVKSMRTTKEVKKKLRKITDNKKVIKAVIKHLQNDDLINDKQYAIMYVKTQLSLSNKGPKQIRLHLLRKGISDANISIGLSYYTNDNQLQHAVNIVNKLAKRYQYSNNSFNKTINKIKANLVRKGYSFEIASNAINSANLKPNRNHQHELLHQKLKRARRKYTRYKRNNPYKYRQKIMEYLYRQGFSFDTISQVLN